MRNFLLLILSIFSFSCAFANDTGIEVYILQQITNACPGQVATVQAKIINRSCCKQILVGHLALPPLWEAVPANDMLMHLGAGQCAMQTLMIRVPDTSSPGQYPIAYEVWARDNLNILARDKASIVIGESNVKSPLSLEVTSPPLIEVDTAEVIYLSAIVCNQTAAPYQGQLRTTIPEGWLCCPSGLVELSLEPEESKVLIFAIKVPQTALAGEHAIALSLEECPGFKRSIIAIVKSKIEIKGTVDNLCDAFNLNQMAQFYISYTNKGNVPLKVIVETKTDPPCPIQCSTEPFEIPPYESFVFPIVLLPESCLEEYSQYLLVKLVDAETGEQLYQNPMTLKFVTPGCLSDDPYVRVPAYIKGLALGDRYKQILAAEFAGGGLIDAEKERYIDFFFRVPTNVRHIIYNIDERLYVGMHDLEWDLRLGDTVYELSPLTQLYRYGRGAGVQHYWDKWEAGIHYTQNTLKCEQDPHEFCSYIQCSPNENFSISTNYLHKVEQDIPTSNILTLESVVEFPANVTTEIEVGKNFVPRKKHQDNWAYRFATHGRFYNDTWFSLEKVYAGGQFYGYYNHLNLFSSSLDFPICDRLRLNLNVDRYTQNFSICPDEDPEAIIPKQHQYAANITYCLNQECTLGLNGLLLRAKDKGRSQEFNFYQKWCGFSLNISSWGFNLNTIISFGQQKDYLTHKTTHMLQRYYAYLSKDFSPNLRGSIFYDSGNTNYYDARPWRSGYGGSLSYRFASTGFFEIFLQKLKHTADMLDLSQITANFSYVFKNLHKLQAMAQYYYYRSHYPNDTVVLVSYSMPLSMPVCRRRDIGDLEGVIYDQWNDLRVSGALVGCGGGNATTGQDGKFAFRGLPTGQQCPEIAMLPYELITVNSDKTCVYIKGGSKEKICVPVAPSCSIRGEIILYGYNDLFAVLMDPVNAEILPQGGLESIRVAIVRDQGKEIYTCMTNEKGVFNFPKLRPGEWHIKIFTDQFSAMQELDMNNLVFDIQPGEDRVVLFKVLPKATEVYKL